MQLFILFQREATQLDAKCTEPDGILQAAFWTFPPLATLQLVCNASRRGFHSIIITSVLSFPLHFASSLEQTHRSFSPSCHHAAAAATGGLTRNSNRYIDPAPT